MSQIISVEPLFERLPAAHRQYKEVVVFIHNYGGNRFSFKRHMEWVNSLGFDVITFDLPANDLRNISKNFPINKNWQFGLRHLWADKIEDVLGHLAENKILYSFSFPSMSTLMAMHRRHCIDISAWICDGGPAKQIGRGFENFIRQGKFSSKADRLLNHPMIRPQIVRALKFISGGANYDHDIDRALKSLPKGFPVLSIRYTKDELVTPDMIDDFFTAGFGHIDLQRFNLNFAGHLLGLRDEGDLYRQTVATFLTSRATKIE